MTAGETKRKVLFAPPLAAALGVAALLLVWAAASLWAGSYLVPSPWTTAADTALLLSRTFTWSQIGVTLARICVGFFAGFAAGLAVGILAGSRPASGAFFRPIVQFFQGMPPLLWAIPLVALMGIGHLPTISVIALITFPLVAVTIAEGMTTLPRPLEEMLGVYAPGFLPRIRELVFPHLKPFLSAAVKAGGVLAVKASVTAEYFGAGDGIGFQIQSSYMSFRIRNLFAWAIVLILIILAFSYVLPRIGILWPPLRRLLGLISPRAGQAPPSAALLSALPGLFGKGSRDSDRISRGTRRIVVRGVGFSWPGEETLLEDISLTVSSGRIAVIAGDSGVGKTTLLKLIASLIRPVTGSVRRPSRLGLIFQDDRLLPWRSVEDNTALPLVYGGRPRREALWIARSLLAEVGLAGAETRRPEELSGGMKKRAALARCFARQPDAILMDEPFSGLHADARKSLWALFLRLLSLRPLPTIIVTHFPREVSSAASSKVYRLAGRPARLGDS
ncbi:MAG: ATP-binding cassette domain-containing protein [Spirochaetia bacterium]|jgi:ABC-type nitrate/sulfonate/bicarbonate transport system ATPase subunit/ABC-type nitrate/sulfonate/bicarbonate transport system permease component